MTVKDNTSTVTPTSIKIPINPQLNSLYDYWILDIDLLFLENEGWFGSLHLIIKSTLKSNNADINDLRTATRLISEVMDAEGHAEDIRLEPDISMFGINVSLEVLDTKSIHAAIIYKDDYNDFREHFAIIRVDSTEGISVKNISLGWTYERE